MDADKQWQFPGIVSEVEQMVRVNENREATLQAICQLLHDHIDYYHWVGFYLVDPQKDRELYLGPYVGEPTEHTRIPFGKGICGQAADKETTFVIQDVSRENNYLSCSAQVKSEIVVPMFKNSRVIGQIDIDSHVLSPFSEADQKLLERICELAASMF